jgi:hypothetical protein
MAWGAKGILLNIDELLKVAPPLKLIGEATLDPRYGPCAEQIAYRDSDNLASTSSDSASINNPFSVHVYLINASHFRLASMVGIPLQVTRVPSCKDTLGIHRHLRRQ